MPPFPRWSAALLPLFLMAAVARAADPVTPELTPRLDQLLTEEMQAVQEAMHAIHTGIVTGDHATVAERAEAIHASFILKRELTEADRRDLKAAVPDDFLKRDQRFHATAAELAEAAEAKDTGQELHLYRRMTDSCIACHGEYVSDRFPGLKGPD